MSLLLKPAITTNINTTLNFHVAVFIFMQPSIITASEPLHTYKALSLYVVSHAVFRCAGTQRWRITCRRRKQCWVCSLCCWTAPHWSSLLCSTVMSGRTNLHSYSASWLATDSKSCTATCTTVRKGVCVCVFYYVCARFYCVIKWYQTTVVCEYETNCGHDPKTGSILVILMQDLDMKLHSLTS